MATKREYGRNLQYATVAQTLRSFYFDSASTRNNWINFHKHDPFWEQFSWNPSYMTLLNAVKEDGQE